LALLVNQFCSKTLENAQGVCTHHFEYKNADHFLIGCPKKERNAHGAACLPSMIVQKMD